MYLGNGDVVKNKAGTQHVQVMFPYPYIQSLLGTVIPFGKNRVKKASIYLACGSVLGQI